MLSKVHFSPVLMIGGCWEEEEEVAFVYFAGHVTRFQPISWPHRFCWYVVACRWFRCWTSCASQCSLTRWISCQWTATSAMTFCSTSFLLTQNCRSLPSQSAAKTRIYQSSTHKVGLTNCAISVSYWPVLICGFDQLSVSNSCGNITYRCTDLRRLVFATSVMFIIR